MKRKEEIGDMYKWHNQENPANWVILVSIKLAKRTYLELGMNHVSLEDLKPYGSYNRWILQK